MASPPSSDFLQVVHRPDLAVLVGRWLRQTTDEEMRQGYAELLDAAEAQQCQRWLIDARRRAHANQQGAPWMMETFFPQVEARLRKPVYMAYLFSPAHLAVLEADAKVPPLSYFDGRSYHVQRFIDEHSAMAWLAECQTLVAG